MEFQQASIALLASMVLVLAGMVGWLYWQQTKIFQNMNNIVAVVGELAQRPAQIAFPEPVRQEEVAEEEEVVDEDDRATVEDEGRPEVPVVDGPPDHLDTDNLDEKTKKELQDILTKRGIPFSKGDTKTALISLLKATS